MNKILIAKQLLKIANDILLENKFNDQVEKIIENKLQNNPNQAIDNLSDIINDKQFDSLVKEVKSASIKTAYKEDISVKTIQKDINKWIEFANKLKKYCAGKPRYVIAATGAVLYSYLVVELAKVMWIDGLFDTSASASINQFISFILGLSYVSSVPGVYHMIKNLLKNIFKEREF